MILAAAAAALLLTAAPAPAADPAVLAVQVSRLVLTPEGYQQLTEQTARSAGQAVTARLGADLPRGKPGFEAELQAGIADMVHDLMPPYQEMVDLQAGLLVKHYTARELQELLAFYRTPLGQKMIRRMPEVTADVMAWMQGVMQQRLPGAAQRFKARLDAWERGSGGSAPAQDGEDSDDGEDDADEGEAAPRR